MRTLSTLHRSGAGSWGRSRASCLGVREPGPSAQAGSGILIVRLVCTGRVVNNNVPLHFI